MKRLLSPATNLSGYITAGGVVYAAIVMVDRVITHQGVFDPQEVVAAVAAVLAFANRQITTPVADPVGADGRALVPAPPVAPVGQMSPITQVPRVAPDPPAERQAF